MQLEGFGGSGGGGGHLQDNFDKTNVAFERVFVYQFFFCSSSIHILISFGGTADLSADMMGIRY